MRRRFGRPPYRLIAICTVLAVLVAVRLLSNASRDTLPSDLLEAGEYRVRRAVDGDTLLLENGIRVRLIGVDAPETVKPDHPVERWGPEASAFTKDFISGGVVRLEFDRERLDRYGRHLAYVWVGERLLNEALVRAGLARYEPQYKYSEAKKRLFRAAEKEAQAARRGIWSTETPAGARAVPGRILERVVRRFPQEDTRNL
jgi:micrococcal nuclease